MGQPAIALKTRSLREQVQDAIRQSIMSRELQPGDPIREMHFARHFQVSQATVREALLELEQMGFVVREANRGTRVVKLGPDDIRNLLDIRIALEPIAAKAAASRMNEGDFQRLDSLLAEILQCVEGNEYLGMYQADLAFHRCIWDLSGNPYLVQALERVTVPIFAGNVIIMSKEGTQLTDIVRSHEPILKAMRTKVPRSIEREVKNHIRLSYDSHLTNPIWHEAQGR